MDETIVKEILDELIPSFEALETKSAAILLFLKDQGIATDEKLTPYLEQAARTSDVRWRAVRVRMGALLAAAMKPSEKVAVEEKQTEAAKEGKEEDASAVNSRPQSAAPQDSKEEAKKSQSVDVNQKKTTDADTPPEPAQSVTAEKDTGGVPREEKSVV